MPSSWKIAAARGALMASVAFGLTGLTTWAASDDPKVIVIAAGTAGLTVIAGRIGLEGYADRGK